MRCIAMTGGLATGKSTVARLLEQHGAIVVDADTIAREIVEPGTDAYREVVSHFGSSVVSESGSLNRSALATIIFSDSDERHALERITHPRIRTLLVKRVTTALTTDVPLVVAEIPLLYESHLEKGFSGVLLVATDEPTQRQRLRARDGLSELEIDQRIASQLPIDAKRPLATWVIDNGGDRAATEAQIVQWWKTVVG